jgi:thiamine-monophosphate kinase
MSSVLKLSELGEFGLLAELERQGLARQIGNDAALLGERLVVTHDLLVEDVHFRRRWISARDLGYKAAAVNLSDLAAMGAEPEALLVGLAVPPDTETELVLELYEGLNEPGIPVVGGDTTAAEKLTVGLTALGRSERAPGRGGARPGDALVVTGPLGGAAAGLYVLERGLHGLDHFVERHRRPPLRLAEGKMLAVVAHALIDLSDGIATDAARIAERSGCRLVIRLENLPLAPGLDEVADAPFWTHGEDYELLAAVASEDSTALGFPVVGECVKGSGVAIMLDGTPVDVEGWDSFRRR